MNLVRIIITFLTLISFSHIAFTGDTKMFSKSNSKVENLILQITEEEGLKNINLEWKKSISNSYTVQLTNGISVINISFSAKEIKAIESDKIEKNTIEKIHSSINLLSTGNKGPRIIPNERNK